MYFKKLMECFFLPRLTITVMACTLATGILILGYVLGSANTKTYENRAQPVAQQTESVAAISSRAVGQPAPGFSLPNQDNAKVKLGDLRGSWVVLYFYPKDDTPGCTAEASEFTELLSTFRQMNAHVYGMSRDTVESHRRFRKVYSLKLDLLSDPEGKTMRSYGALVDAAFADVSYERIIRCTYLIDPKGRVRYHWPEVIPEGHAERVRNRLEVLQS